MTEKVKLDVGCWRTNKVEDEAINKFVTEHYHSCAKGRGGFFRVCMYGAGMGTAIEVECLICGAKENVTDYGSW